MLLTSCWSRGLSVRHPAPSAHKKTRPTRSRVVYRYHHTASPVRGLGVAASGIWKLMSGEVLCDKILHEVSADVRWLCSAEQASDLPSRFGQLRKRRDDNADI